MNTEVCGVTLVPAQSKTALGELLELFPNARRLFAVDFYVTGAESWAPLPWGWRCQATGTVVSNVDHHAPVSAMMRAVSSGNLAATYVRQHGPVAVDDTTYVVVNHCDTDSVVAAATLLGLLPLEQRFEEAVVAADHSGAENLVADALQGLETRRDLALALETLFALRDNVALPAVAQNALEQRQEQRNALRELVASQPQLFQRFGVVTLYEGTERVPAELLPALLPETVVLLTTSPKGEGYAVKARLGNAAPAGHTLFSLGLPEFDPEYGGRWNAGSNARGNGTLLKPREYAQQLAAFVEERLS